MKMIPKSGLLVMGLVAAVILGGSSPASARVDETQVLSAAITRGVRAIRSWSHVDLWQASIGVPKDWVLVDLTATDPFPSSTPTIFQLTNFDPRIDNSPVCLAGRSGRPPSDAVLLTVGTGVPTDVDLLPSSSGKCPTPTEIRRWNENGNDYWAVIATRRDGDPARAYRVLRQMALPPTGTQDTAVLASSDKPQVIWASGEIETGPWVAYGDHKWQCLGEQTGGACGAPSRAPKGDSLWTSYGTGSMGDETHPYIGIDGIVAARVNRVLFYDKHGVRTRAEVVSVPRSLWGGRANAFIVVVPLTHGWRNSDPFNPKNGNLVLFHNSDRLTSLPL